MYYRPNSNLNMKIVALHTLFNVYSVIASQVIVMQQSKFFDAAAPSKCLWLKWRDFDLCKERVDYA